MILSCDKKSNPDWQFILSIENIVTRTNFPQKQQKKVVKGKWEGPMIYDVK